MTYLMHVLYNAKCPSLVIISLLDYGIFLLLLSRTMLDVTVMEAIVAIVVHQQSHLC